MSLEKNETNHPVENQTENQHNQDPTERTENWQSSQGKRDEEE